MPPAPHPSRRLLSRAGRLALIGGLASGAAFAAVTGISSAASGPTPVTGVTPTTGATTTVPSSRPSRGGHGRFGAPGPFGGFGPGGGNAGTVTEKSGTTLTLRTEAGTETVTTTSSTVFTKERQTVSLDTVAVGDVVRVAAPEPSGNATQTPGTGTVAATRVMIVEPTLTGRVQSVGTDGSYVLVGPEGQMLTVTTTGSTQYFSGTTKATSSAVTAGSYIVAEGPQDTLTHLQADVISVRPARTGTGGAGAGGFRPWGGGPPELPGQPEAPSASA